ncbi:MAG TPA: HAMP domain-containing sensor histidine kinase [Nocardioidaceae bacterium]|nr:HAMP domain-containing sensor histidine kinase [Nocardioidaceae bacterium]
MGEEDDYATARHTSDSALVRLCHDLRQHLAAGLMLARVQEIDGAGSAAERFALIADELTSAEQLIAAELDAMRSRTWMVDLVELVEQCVRTVRLTHDVVVAVRAAEQTVAYGDPVALRRAVGNVLDNAARAAGDAGAVEVNVGPQGDLAFVEVADNGQGFGGLVTTSGQGLSIVHQAVRSNGGRLEISSGPGPGTRVRMLWPRGPARSGQSEHAQPARRTRPSRTPPATTR